MIILNSIENIKGHGNLHAVLDLIKKDEPYDKTKSVLSGDVVYKLCYERYLEGKKILEPLRRKLSDYFEIIDIEYVDGLNDDPKIVVTFRKNGIVNSFAMECTDYNLVDVFFANNNEVSDIVTSNKYLVSKTFDELINEVYFDNYCMMTTSNKFIIDDNARRFMLNDSDEKALSIQGYYSSYEKKGQMYDPEKLNSSFKKIKSLLQDEDTVKKILSHTKVYEETICKSLIKK